MENETNTLQVIDNTNGLIVLDSINKLLDVKISNELVTSEEFVNGYTNLIAVSKYLEDLKKNLDAGIKDFLKTQYLETGDATIESNGYKYTYIPETVRESLDTKNLKANDPELYKKYVKISNVSDSLRVTKKDK